MIKGTNRRMFRRPRPAREASGILASSQELINQVLPLRMQGGGDPFAELKKLIERQSASIEEPGFLDLLQSLGVGALQSEAIDPSRSTLQNLARALPFALESLDKKELAADQRALALAQASGQLTQMEKELQIAQNEALRKAQKLNIDEFNARLTTPVKNALASMGVDFSPRTNQLMFKGKETNLTELQDPETSPLTKDQRQLITQAMSGLTEDLSIGNILSDPNASRGLKQQLAFTSIKDLEFGQRDARLKQLLDQINRQSYLNYAPTLQEQFGGFDQGFKMLFSTNPAQDSQMLIGSAVVPSKDEAGNVTFKFIDILEDLDGSLKFRTNASFKNRFGEKGEEFGVDGDTIGEFTKSLGNSYTE